MSTCRHCGRGRGVHEDNCFNKDEVETKLVKKYSRAEQAVKNQFHKSKWTDDGRMGKK